MSELTVRRSIIGIGVAAIAVSAGLVGRATLASAKPESVHPAANVAVDCEPTQRAIVRQSVVAGESRVAIECATISRVGGVEGAAPYASLVPGPALPAGQAVVVPAVYQVPATPPVHATAPSVSAVSAPRRVVSSTAADRPRSWQKRAVVIGGAAGAGAGIGALIGGKKGALIGAAVGGGSGTLYEIVKK